MTATQRANQLASNAGPTERFMPYFSRFAETHASGPSFGRSWWNSFFSGICLMVASLVASCATGLADDTPNNTAAANDPADILLSDLQISNPQAPDGDSGSMAQIAVSPVARSADQIRSDETDVSLSMGQLREFADRCAPGAANPLPQSRCSEMSLSIRRAMRSDDDIAEALAIIDRLGVPVGNDLVSRLEKGDLRGFDAQAVVSGALSADPVQPEEPEEERLLPSDIEALGEAIGIIVETQGQ